MTDSDELEKLKEKYSYEIASFRRTVEKFNLLRSWLINTSLASLAFVVTLLAQARLESVLPGVQLAQFSVGFLMASAICALYTKFCYEASGLMTDVKDFATLFPVFMELINKDEGASEDEKADVTQLLQTQIDRIKSVGGYKKISNPYAELWRFGATSLTLFAGLACSCAYFWLYLF